MAGKIRYLVCLAIAMLLVTALAAAIPVTAQAAEPEQHCVNQDDVNGDGIVTEEDALYILFNQLFGGEQYPLSGSHDYVADGVWNRLDALHLKHAANQEDSYALLGVRHELYAPSWTWNMEEGTASVTFRCSCGAIVEQLPAAVESSTVTVPGCTTAGQDLLTATVSYGGTDYSDSRTVAVAATGHSQGAPTCEAAYQCENCDYSLPALGHSWERDEDSDVKAACSAPGQEAYRCTTCRVAKTVPTQCPASAYIYVGDRERTETQDDPCDYVKRYQCADCDEIVDGQAESDSIHKHNYQASVAQEPTCEDTGLKKYECTVCHTPDPSKQEADKVIPVSTIHTWDAGVTVDNTTTYTCTVCEATKIKTDNGAVTKDQLTGNDVALDNDASLSMNDEAVNNIQAEQTITIKVEAVNKDTSELGLTEQQQQQIPGETVYNFSMVDQDGAPVDFGANGGSVTISLPYTLQPGDDVDHINVWYIEDDGRVSAMVGTYSNGYVTFTTTHFSYYTVTRLTPEERCLLYFNNEHDFVKEEKAADCTHAGYVRYVCSRCGTEDESRAATTPALGHNMVVVEEGSKSETCTEDGVVIKKCSNEGCSYTTRRDIPATGHQLVETENTPASCTAPGVLAQACSACDYTIKTTFEQLEHTLVLKETVAVSCTADGYELWGCTTCSLTERRAEVDRLGHSYTASWFWAEDYSSATLTMTCANDPAHTQQVQAVVAMDAGRSAGATCVDDGKAVYTAAAAFNGKSYQDTYYVTIPATGHRPGQAWESSGNLHYHVCMNCDNKSEIGKHSWVEGAVTTAPTCSTTGVQAMICEVCSQIQDKTIPATGIHVFRGGECVDCGMESATCDHLRLYSNVIPGSDLGLCAGTNLVYITCDCDKVGRYELDSVICDLVQHQGTTVTPDGTIIETIVNTCADCGLQVIHGEYEVYSTDPCQSQYFVYRKIAIGDQVLVETTECVGSLLHPMVGEAQVTELTMEEHGICGVTVSVRSCACGKNVVAQGMDDSQCAWVPNYASVDGMREGYICENCGAEKVSVRQEVKDEHCGVAADVTSTIYKDGNVLFTVDTKENYVSHRLQMVDAVLFGATCEEGGKVTLRCVDCGAEEQETFSYHCEYPTSYVDLEGTGLCGGELVQYSCPCGFSKYFEECLECSWHYEPAVDGEDSIHRWVCDTCGGMLDRTTEASEKDEHCFVTYFAQYAYKNAAGQIAATMERIYQSDEHDMRTTYKLSGSSCQDGLTITEHCQDCGYEYTWETRNHYYTRLESYELTGCCASALVVYGCPCGEERDYRFEGGSCKLEYTSSEDGVWVGTCQVCGLVQTERNDRLATDQACHYISRETITVTKDGVELATVQRKYEIIGHDYERTLVLVPGATSCEEGYTIVHHCRNCGDTHQEETVYTDHDQYEVSRELLTDALCGNVYRVEFRCACGEHSASRIEWDRDVCFFEHVGYDEQTGASIYMCGSCGALREERHLRERVEGTTCDWIGTWLYIYKKDGVELFTEANSYQFKEHDLVYTFNMQGQTCQEGYTVTGVCINCGITEHNDYVYKECISWQTEKVLLHDGSVLCGKVWQRTEECPCGAYYREGYRHDVECSWEYREDQGLYACTNCHAVRKDTWYSEEIPGETCKMMGVWVYEFLSDGNTLFLAREANRYESHDDIVGFDRLGSTCAEGYYVNYTCLKCGRVSKSDLRDWCEVLRVGRELLNENSGMCGNVWKESYSCSCGAEHHENYIWEQNCDWGEMVYDEELGMDVATCAQCHTQRRHWTEWTLLDGQTCRYMVTNYQGYFVNGQQIFATSDSNEQISHNYETVYRMLGEHCSDGYYQDQVCTGCGNCIPGEYLYEQCNTYQVSRELVLENSGICASIWKERYECPCGSEAYEHLSHDYPGCSFGPGEYDEEHDAWQGSCTVCGLKRVSYSEEAAVPGETCKFLYTNYTDYYLNGTLVASASCSSYQMRHDHIQELRLNVAGGTCDDGYYVDNICIACGDKTTGDVLQYGCSNYLLSKELVYDGENMCSAIWHTTLGCACGKVSSTQYEREKWCNWGEPVYDEALDATVYTCTECHAQQRCWSEETPINGETCWYTNTNYTGYYVNGVEVLVTSDSWTYESHDRQEVCRLEVAGGTCYDGYYIDMICRDCADVEQGTERYTGCSNHTLDDTQICDVAGMCGPVVLRHVGCACGEEQNYHMVSSCNWQIDHYDETLDTYIDICTTCGAQRAEPRTYRDLSDKCKEEVTFRMIVWFNGETVADHSTTYTVNTHTLLYTYQMVEGALTCADGYYASGVCVYCDYEKPSDGVRDWCSTNLVELVDLSTLGGCGGRIERYSCACGQNQYTYHFDECSFLDEWESGEDAEGTYEIRTGTCTACGTTVTEITRPTHIDGTCTARVRHEYTYRLGDQSVTVSCETTEEDHNWGPEEYSLVDGATSCVDGVQVIRHCQNCGESQTNTHFGGHMTYVTERIDLAQFGSVCGGYLEHLECACGKAEEYALSDDTLCDLDLKPIDLWVSNAMPEGSRETAYGWMNFTNEAYDMPCAVSDPVGCGLHIRRAEYWVQEGCLAVRYVTWQLGYDPATGTAQAEYTYATDRTEHIHSWPGEDEGVKTSETLADGTVKTTNVRTCSLCGSSITRTECLLNNVRTEESREYLNLLKDGTNTRDYYHNKYEQTSTGINRVVYTRYERTGADGTEYWDQHVYSFVSLDSCECTATHTGSHCADSVNTEMRHESMYHEDEQSRVEATCTQPGSYTWYHLCQVCGEVVTQQTEILIPYGHNWNYNETTGTWCCTTCNLESTEGADGSIILEDLTGKYGNGTNYVVGYYNREEGDFDTYMMVVLDSVADGEQNKLMLSGIDFTQLTQAADGVNAMAANIQQAQAAASAALAEAGYTGGYALRMVFLPVGSEDLLEYGITFDSLTA